MMLRNQVLSFLKSAFSILLMGGAFCCWTLLCVWAIQHLSDDSKNQSSATEAAAVAMATTTDSATPVKITNELRYTTMGWQTPSHWVRQPTQVSQLSIAQFNPVLLALVILLASLLAILVYADDEEIERLLKSSELKGNEAVALKLNRLRK